MIAWLLCFLGWHKPEEGSILTSVCQRCGKRLMRADYLYGGWILSRFPQLSKYLDKPLWKMDGFVSLDWGYSCGFAMSLFRNPRTYVNQKYFVVDIWIPFFTVRLELRKGWPEKEVNSEAATADSKGE